MTRSSSPDAANVRHGEANPAMVDDVFLHVGVMKSGTSYLQQKLMTNAAELGEQGVLFPGPRWHRQVRAVRDLIDSPRKNEGDWDDLAQQIRSHPGRALISDEHLGPMAPRFIDRAIESFPDRRVRALVTVRDVGRAVPAMWQESLKNQRTWTWREFLAGLEEGDTEGAGQLFWKQQNFSRVVRRWVRKLGPESVTVITVPPRGAPKELLWERFCSAAGIEHRDWQEPVGSNESLGAASAAMLRQLNELLTDLERPLYDQVVKKRSKRLLGPRRAVEDAIGFTVPSWLKHKSAEMVAEVKASGATVVGNLDDLTPLDVPGVSPNSVTADDVSSAALHMLAAILSVQAGAETAPGPIQGVKQP